MDTSKENAGRKHNRQTDFQSHPITSAEHLELARAADAADYSVCGRLSERFGIDYINIYKYFKGEQRVPLDRAEDVGSELGIDPSRICANYRIDRERASRKSTDVHDQPEFEALQVALKKFHGTLGDLCADMAAELSVNKNRIKLWLTGNHEVPHEHAKRLAAYIGTHPAAISMPYLALHRFPRPEGEDPAAPIPTGPYTEGEWLADRAQDPPYRPMKVRANMYCQTTPHPVPADSTQCANLDTAIQGCNPSQEWPDAAISITARAISLTLKVNPTAAMELMRDLLMEAGQEVYSRVSANLTA